MSNMKQLGLGFMQYVQDFDEKYPWSYKDGMAYHSGAMGWGGRIYPYVKNEEVYRCPSDGRPNKGKVSYSSNDNIGGFSTSSTPPLDVYKMVQTSQFGAPALTVLLLETSKVQLTAGLYVSENSDEHQTASTDGYQGQGGQGAMRFATGPISGCPDYYSVTPPVEAMPPGRHLEGANYLAVDGHVKWLKAERVSRGLDVTASAKTAAGNCSVTNRPAGTANMGTYALTFSIY